MLQSEFFERTKVTLDGTQYAKVEAIYNEVEMDKDEFCAEWKKLRNSKLMGEIETAMHTMTRESEAKDKKIAELKAQLTEKDRLHNNELMKQVKEHSKALEEFAKRIVRANEAGDSMVYDVIEEDFGIGFIIKTKHESGIPLTDAEISYMVGKL